jgi:hypothetical protein
MRIDFNIGYEMWLMEYYFLSLINFQIFNLVEKSIKKFGGGAYHRY